MSSTAVIKGTLRLVLLLLAGYGLLYFSYKNYDPAGTDFVRYIAVFQHPLDFSQSTAPYVFRQISAVLVNGIHALGLYYPAEIRFADTGIDQHWFFAALFANYTCLIATAWVAGACVVEVIGADDVTHPLVAGLLCLLSFHTQSVVITGLTEGASWLLLALCMWAWLGQRWQLLLCLLAVSILQRETIAVAILVTAAWAWLYPARRTRWNVAVFAWALACFGGYLALRLFTGLAGSEEQVSPSLMADALGRFALTRDVFMQGLMAQNVLAIFLILSLWAWRSVPELRYWLPALLMASAALWVMAIAANTGSNAGRVCGVLTPAFAVWASICLQRKASAKALRG